MFRRLSTTVIAVLAAATANAQTITVEDLIGVWNYTSYAEIETPDRKLPVDARMDFRPDGTIVMTIAGASAEGTFSLDGDTIHYSDTNGPQEWTVRSHVPGETLVVEYQRALLFFEKAE